LIDGSYTRLTFGSREDLDPKAQHNRRAPGSNKL